jgi:cell division protein FtsW
MWTLLLSCSLLSVGIVMLYSSSGDLAVELTGDHMYFFKRQLARILVGLIGLAALWKLDYHHLSRLAPWLMIGSLILLGITLIVGSQDSSTTVARWLRLGSLSIQPSDIARISLIAYLAAYLDRKGGLIEEFRQGLLPPILVIGLTMALIVLQPDFSTAVLVGIMGTTLLFLGGARLRHLLVVSAASLPLMSFVMVAEPYRLERLKTYLGIGNSPDAGYQISQSLISLGNGGWIGQGLGNSIEKKLLLPAPHTDFVFAIIGEELGFIGAIILLVGFFWLFQRGIVIARKAPDRFGLFLALGIVLNLIIYVLVNVAVVTEVFPNTGIPLPLISYGGTHIVFTLVSIGVLLNISTSSHRRRWEERLSRVHVRP